MKFRDSKYKQLLAEAKKKATELDFESWIAFLKDNLTYGPTDEQIVKLKIKHEILNSPLAKAMREE